MNKKKDYFVTNEIKPIHYQFIKDIIKYVQNNSITTNEEITDYIRKISKIYKLHPSKTVLGVCYRYLLKSNDVPNISILNRYFIKLPVRSFSGVLVVTLVLKPDKFSCSYDCKYCPNETIENGAEVDIARSYLSSEPAVMRGKSVNFDIVEQFNLRLNTLKQNGHTIDKIEIIVLGGTFSNYPRDYQYEACRDMFYAANLYNKQNKRDKYSLQYEQQINETNDIKIIGISLETRPDQINKYELKRFRVLGCTRVQIGVQHTNNKILELINRKHDVEASIKAIKLLKDFGFKVDIHIMPDLPGSNFDEDKIMFDTIFKGEDFQADYMKIYPCLDVTYTEIRKWKEDGRWIPYAETDMGKLTDLIIYAKQWLVPKYLRLNRIQRDFPEEHDNNKKIGFVSDKHKSNFRQLIDQELQKRNLTCKCIRCREIKLNNYKIKDIRLNVEKYNASKGIEHFISFDDNKQDKLLGFIRLRLPEKHKCTNHFMSVLNNSAIIRELHVYGSVASTYEKSKNKTSMTQHMSYGKHLIMQAEINAYINGFNRIAVISGVGVRDYYRKFNYTLKNTYMIKHLSFLTFMYNILLMVLFKIKIYIS